MTTFEPLPWATKIPLIGLGYRAGSGKDTVADYLVQRHGFVKVSFAGALKRAARDLCGFTEAQVNGTLAEKETVDSRWGFSPRWFLQRFGTEVGRAIDPDFWIKVLDARLRGPRGGGGLGEYVTIADTTARGVVISDMRFPNELAAVRAWGGVAVEVYRPEAYARVETHASETSLAGATFDLVFKNTSTLADLYKDADVLVQRCTVRLQGGGL